MNVIHPKLSGCFFEVGVNLPNTEILKMSDDLLGDEIVMTLYLENFVGNCSFSWVHRLRKESELGQEDAYQGDFLLTRSH